MLSTVLDLKSSVTSQARTLCVHAQWRQPTDVDIRCESEVLKVWSIYITIFYAQTANIDTPRPFVRLGLVARTVSKPSSRPHLEMHLLSVARRVLMTFHLLSALTTASLISPPVSKPSLPPPPTPSHPPSLLASRVLITHSPLGTHWHQFLEALAPIFPNPPACTHFANFYTALLANLAPGGRWAHLPEWQSFTIGYGNVRLDFHSSLGTVPWALVMDFARTMAGHSRRGFAGSFRYVYFHAATGLAVTVWLSLGGGGTGGGGAGVGGP